MQFAKVFMFFSSVVNYFQSLAEKGLKLISAASQDGNYQPTNSLAAG